MIEKYQFCVDGCKDENFSAAINDVKEKIQSNYMCFLEYCKSFFFSGVVNTIVDIGWKGTMQRGIEQCNPTLHFNGYYLGLLGDQNNDYKINKQGIIFDENNKYSYINILRSNTQLYELLAAAPHGSAQTYVLTKNGVDTLNRWEENEKRLYEYVIKDWQKKAELLFEGQVVWMNKNYCKERSNALVVWKSSLFANKKRIKFLKELDKGFVWNFGKESKGLKYDKKRVKIGFNIISKPEIYMRYFAKVQRLLPENFFVQVLYRIGISFYSLYMWLVYDIKNLCIRCRYK